MLWCYYSPAERPLRKGFWEELSLKVKVGPSEWVCIGDFNNVISQDEKLGGKPVSIKLNYYLRSFIFYVAAQEIGYCGNTYTWLVSPDWLASFEQAGVVHLSSSVSNHIPIQLFLSLDHQVKV